MELNGETLFKLDKNRLYLTILFIIFAFYLLYIYSFLLLDKSLPIGDDLHHLRFVFDYYNNFKTGGTASFFLKPVTFYPPFVYYVAAIFMSVFGVSVNTAVLSQSIFLFILIFSVFFIGKTLFNEDTGFLSAVAVVTIPIVNQYCNNFYLDIPVTAMTALSVLCLLKSNLFKNPVWSYSFFIFAALGILTKMQFALYIMPPFIITLALFLRENFKDTGIKVKLVNSLYFITLAVSPILSFLYKKHLMDKYNKFIFVEIVHIGMYWDLRPPFNKPGFFEMALSRWYFVSLVPLVLAFIIFTIFKPAKKAVDNFIRGALLSIILMWHFYGMFFNRILNFSLSLKGGAGATANIFDFIALASRSLSPLFVVFTIVGVVFYCFYKEKNRDNKTVLASLIITLILLYLFPRKEDRWLMPLAIYAAPVATFWIFTLKKKYLRFFLSAFFLYFCFMNQVGWIVYENFIALPYKFYERRMRVISHETNLKLFSSLFPPIKRGIDIESISKSVYELGKNKRNLIAWVSDYPPEKLDPSAFWTLAVYLRYKHDKPVRFFNGVWNWDQSKEVFIHYQPGSHKETKDNRYHCIFMSDNPREKEIKSYDNLIIIYSGESGEDRIYPYTFSQNLKELKINNRADIIISPGKGSGMENIDISTIITRIPIKPAAIFLPQEQPKDLHKTGKPLTDPE